MAFSEQVIDQVQQASDIVDVVSSYVPLKRAGRNYKALCPFHHEKTPSFMVNPDKQIFHCFGCGVGGDVFSFVMKHEQMGFPEALRHLADRARICLPEASDTTPEARSLNERLYQIYALASEFYHTRLTNPALGEQARSYLAKRSFDLEAVKTFQLGFAPPEWRALLQMLTKKGFRDEELLRSGLIVRSVQGEAYDLFRNRIIFPIMNAQGKLIAFGGRVLGDETPKYLNSPETSIFKKRKELYALHLAKRFISAPGAIRRVLITEGYLDCIRLYMSGFQNVVASLGTSLTEEHVRNLKRYADEAIVIFDPDPAGEQASLRSLDLFLEEGMAVKVLSLPQGIDPDDFVRARGPEAMKPLIEESQDFFDFKLRVLLARYNRSDSLGLLKVTGEFLDSISKIKNAVLVDRYLKRLSANLGVEETSLRSELKKLKQKQTSLRFTKPAGSQVGQTSDKEGPFENILLSLLLNEPMHLTVFQEMFPHFVFSSEKANKVLHLLGQMAHEEALSRHSASKLLNRVRDPELKNYVSNLLVREWGSARDRDRAFHDCMERLRKGERSEQLKALRHQISQAEKTGDEKLVLQYVREYQGLLGKG
ncbi:MAG: DNA primase [Omnitrophica bacterium RIFCSPLOWO2_12_FULL_50_11]|nr:MAG: DNA primase [Omnitrophica bacterium RIFCSPLOWO2_12_FULL_50_11]